LATLLAEKTGAELDRAGRIAVNPDCSLPGHPEVFAIGDMVSLNKLPGVAQPAMQEGTYVGELIESRIAEKPAPAPFKYFDKGSMATIGHKAAVADAFGLKFTGFIAYLMWGFIHVAYLIGWGNRFGTMYNWARAVWFSNNRAHRIITFERAGTELPQGVTRSGRPSPIMPAGSSSTAAVPAAAEPPIGQPAAEESARSAASETARSTAAIEAAAAARSARISKAS
jgi:NADH dehydrogenase